MHPWYFKIHISVTSAESITDPLSPWARRCQGDDDDGDITEHLLRQTFVCKYKYTIYINNSKEKKAREQGGRRKIYGEGEPVSMHEGHSQGKARRLKHWEREWWWWWRVVAQAESGLAKVCTNQYSLNFVYRTLAPPPPPASYLEDRQGRCENQGNNWAGSDA